MKNDQEPRAAPAAETDRANGFRSLLAARPRRRGVVLLVLACVGSFAGTRLEALDFSGYVPIGDVSAVVRTGRGLDLECGAGRKVELTVLEPDLARVRALFQGQSSQPDHSWAIARTTWPPVAWKLAETPSDVTVTTAAMQIRIRRSPLLISFLDPATHRVINADYRPVSRDPRNGAVGAAKRLGLEEHFYGLGEKAAWLDRRRGKFVMWNSDTPGYVEGTDPIYQSIPFYVGLENGAAYGLFYDNSYRTTFDFGQLSQESVDYQAQGGELNYYFFAGPSLKRILELYTELTGRMPLPPLWALGNQQSRYSYYPDTLVEKIADRYREDDLPLDVLYLDIHYMNGYRDFTWDPGRFPDPRRLLDRLKRQGIRVVTIVDPGIKYQPPAPGSRDPATEPDRAPQKRNYYVFDQGTAGDYFLRRRDGSLYVGKVWPGKAVFTDYTLARARRWWGDLHRPFLDEGVAGIWDDMNEPSDFVDKSGASQADVVFDDLGTHSPYAKNRNVYALNMARATYEGIARLRPHGRPFVITRAGYAGVQRYATMWTGDNNATWASLALNIPMFASLGLSGESYVGADVPGFIGRADGELLTRSYELAFLVPLCRNHGAIDGYDHEPWRFGPRYEAVVRRYLKLRYRLLPFLYTTLEEAHRTGMPFFRPLLLNFQDDRNTLTIDDEFMIGDALLAAPVLRPDVRQRDVYLPQGAWYDHWDDTRVDGPATLTVAAPLDRVPLYFRGGCVVPSTVAMNYVGEKPWSPIRFDVYPSPDGTADGSLYEDDGASPAYLGGAFRRTRIRLAPADGGSRISVEVPVNRWHAPARSLEFILHGPTRSGNVLLDGGPLAASDSSVPGPGWWRDRAGTLHVRITDDGHAHAIDLAGSDERGTGAPRRKP